jgi:predicted  nucleic acid-binding Zn-ribbon protein
MNARIHGPTGTLLALLALGVATPANSQSTGTATPARPVAQRGPEDALLKEVRLIRETLQQAQGNVQREQMLVERIRTHDQRVERLDRQLTEIRDEIGGIEVHVRQMDERGKAMDLQVQRSNDPAQRRALEMESNEMKFTQESQRQRLDRLRARESEITAALNREERTLRNLEARLEALDREIEGAAKRGNTSQLGSR